jgi:thioredoxin-like negative regulator of GroEL
MGARFAAMAAVAAALIAGCKSDKGKGAQGAQGSAQGSAQAKPTEPAATTAACAGAEREHGGAFEWFKDDYARALACAKAKNVPLVIDMWAPWCHTCLSMQAYVLPDPKLADRANRFVFLALDTDREANAAPVAKFPPAAWPTFFVIAPTDETIQSRFVGGGSAEQLAAFLDDGERGFQAASGKPLTAWDAKAREGDQAASAKDWPGAAAAYKAALEAAPKDWVRRPDVLTSLIRVQNSAHDERGCLTTAVAHMNDTGSAAAASDFASYALGCAEDLDRELLIRKDPPTADMRLVHDSREAIVTRLTALTADTAAPLSVDDRSDALMYLREALDALGPGHKDEAVAVAKKQRALLDDAAAKAKTPMEASTYNWPRSEVYLYLGVPLELVPVLEKSSADLPEEYDPPYRLAWIYWKAGKLDLAKQWINTALGKVYGPRKTRAFAMLADIEKAKGDRTAERMARQAIVDTWLALPAEAQSKEAIDKAKADLAAMNVAAH